MQRKKLNKYTQKQNEFHSLKKHTTLNTMGVKKAQKIHIEEAQEG